jgi:hypothetical protein
MNEQVVDVPAEIGINNWYYIGVNFVFVIGTEGSELKRI